MVTVRQAEILAKDVIESDQKITEINRFIAEKVLNASRLQFNLVLLSVKQNIEKNL